MRKKKMDESIYTTEEVARKLRVDVKTIRKWIRAGELVAMDVGGEYRIRESNLQDFIQRRERRKGPKET